MAAAEASDTRSLFRLDGKRVLVVGGYGGIGRLTSELLASAGATVAVAGRSGEKAERAANEIGAGSVGLALDVSIQEAAQAGVGTATERLGGLDVLVNAAGVELHGAAEEVTPEDWHNVIETNLSGAFWLSQAAGRAMIDGGSGGSIVHFSSTRGMVGGRRGFTAYGASKAGVNLLVKQLATEWGQHGITVNGIAPGFVPTPMMEQAAEDNQFMQMMRSRIPLGRFSSPAEIASVALFLASPAASFVSGEVIFVDGGVMASS